MNRNSKARFRMRTLACFALFALTAADCSSEQPAAAAVSGFDRYIASVEARLEQQHMTEQRFLAPADEARLRMGELVIERIGPDPAQDLPGAVIHHWRGTAFAPEVRAKDFERILRNYSDYPRYFSPEVLSARILSCNGNQYKVAMRVRQKHVLTVVMDTTYEVDFGRLDRHCAFSTSRSTDISEIEHAGQPDEHALTAAQNHGFLWRLNTYWSYQERDGGLYLQLESVSLTRSIPPGLGWVAAPFVESVPRESLEFTLRKVRDALGKGGDGGGSPPPAI